MSKFSHWLNKTLGIPERRVKLDAAAKDYVLLRVMAAMDKAHIPEELQGVVIQALKASL